MKIIAFYLPQFHCIPENDNWWGKGFTEWVNVKKAQPLFDGHEQPKIPYGNNYYDLSDVSVMRWQAEIAKKNGLYGFCFYHYWFDGKMLLEKPVDNYLRANDINFPYCICWANENWTNQWVSDDHKTLISQTYGDKEVWREHFNYLLPFFKDKRYIKKDGKPIFVIYRPDIIPKIKKMLDYFDEMAVQSGLDGLCFICQRSDMLKNGLPADISMFDYSIEYQPSAAFHQMMLKEQKYKWLRAVKRNFLLFIEKYLGVSTGGMYLSKINKDNVSLYDYDEVWEQILNSEPQSSKSIPGAFVNWDNTPRKGVRGSAVVGFTPDKFRNYLSRQIRITKERNNQDMIFMFAWNEWAEGGYLEPDAQNGFACLNAIKEALNENKEIKSS